MNRERALKVVLVLIGLMFSGSIFPMFMYARQVPALSMMLSIYVTLGIFLLLASRDPSANRSLIAFATWSSFAHAGLMAAQAYRHMIARRELVGVAVFTLIGAALIALAPAKQSTDRTMGISSREPVLKEVPRPLRNSRPA